MNVGQTQKSLTKQQKVSLSLWSNVSRCTISKSEAWSKLQGLAEINSSMPCFWALSASIQPTAQGREHGSEERTSVRHEQQQQVLATTQKHQGSLFMLTLRANNKHLQLTLSTCIVSDSVKRLNVLVDEILSICYLYVHACILVCHIPWCFFFFPKYPKYYVFLERKCCFFMYSIDSAIRDCWMSLRSWQILGRVLIQKKERKKRNMTKERN